MLRSTGQMRLIACVSLLRLGSVTANVLHIQHSGSLGAQGQHGHYGAHHPPQGYPHGSQHRSFGQYGYGPHGQRGPHGPHGLHGWYGAHGHGEPQLERNHNGRMTMVGESAARELHYRHDAAPTTDCATETRITLRGTIKECIEEATTTVKPLLKALYDPKDTHDNILDEENEKSQAPVQGNVLNFDTRDEPKSVDEFRPGDEVEYLHNGVWLHAKILDTQHFKDGSTLYGVECGGKQNHAVSTELRRVSSKEVALKDLVALHEELRNKTAAAMRAETITQAASLENVTAATNPSSLDAVFSNASVVKDSAVEMKAQTSSDASMVHEDHHHRVAVFLLLGNIALIVFLYYKWRSNPARKIDDPRSVVSSLISEATSITEQICGTAAEPPKATEMVEPSAMTNEEVATGTEDPKSPHGASPTNKSMPKPEAKKGYTRRGRAQAASAAP